MAPLSVVNAVNTQKGKKEKTEAKKEVDQGRKMDGLSLAAHIAITAGIASLFLVPELAIFLIPAGIVMGFIAWLGRKKRYENRQGSGLALEAVLIGGALAFLILISMVGYILSY